MSGNETNLRQEGYDRGLADGSAGLPSQSAASFGLRRPIATTDIIDTGFDMYEEGYDEGYLKGKDVYEKLCGKKD